MALPHAEGAPMTEGQLPADEEAEGDALARILGFDPDSILSCRSRNGIAQRAS